MGDFRARDADRERAVEVIEAAYGTGQFGDADRDLRLSRALSAETLDELDGLTRDLPRAAAQTGSPLPGSRPARTGPPTAVVVAAVAAAAVLLLGVVPLVFLSVGSSDLSSSTSVEAPPVPVESFEESVAPFEMTPGQVRRFLRDYAQEFGEQGAYEVVFFPSRVSVDVPVRGARPRAAAWTYDGTWRPRGAITAVGGSAGVVDLGAVDIRRLFANITTATKVLGVQQGELTHVVVRRRAGEAPVVSIYVGNSFNESGYLSTTPSGQEIRRYPYDA